MKNAPFLALVASSTLLLVGCDDKPVQEDDTGSVAQDDTGSSSVDTDAPGDDTEVSYDGWTLALEGPTTAAPNETVTYTGTLLDADGGDRTGDATLTLSYDGTAQGGLDITPTASGDHEVLLTAALVDQSWTDALTLTVAVGPAYAVDLVLESDQGEIGEGLEWEATVTDQWGNETEDTVTITSDSTSGWSLDGDEIAFTEEGSYTFTATTGAKADVNDTEGPVTVDSNGPLILLDVPGRGAFVEGASTTVSGTVEDPTTGVASLTLDGTAVTVNADGSFSTSTSLEAGANTLTLEATDNDGNTADLIFAVLAGAFQDVDDDNDNGLLVRLNDDALDAMAAPLADELDPAVIEADIKADNPLAYEEVDLGFFTCSVTVDATAFDMDVAEPDLIPAAGELGIEIVISNLDLDLDIELDCGLSSTAAGEITDSEITIDVVTEIEVVAPGDVEVTITQNEVTFTDLDIDLGSLESTLSSYGLGVEDLIDAETLLADELEATIADDLPGALEAALESIEIEETFEIEGARSTLASQLGDLDLDADGMTLTLPTQVSVDSTVAGLATAPGYWIEDGAEPDFAASPGLFLSIELDTLTSVFHSAWAGGAFHLDVSDGSLGLDKSMIGLIFPGATSLDLSLDPQQPPVLAADKAGDLYLHMGELFVDFWGDVDGGYTYLGTGTMHVAVPAELSLSASEELSLAFGTADVTVDILVDDPYEVADSETLQALLGAVASSFGGELFPDMTLGVPDLGDFTLTADDLYLDGDDDSWVTVEGELE